MYEYNLTSITLTEIEEVTEYSVTVVATVPPSLVNVKRIIATNQTAGKEN